MDTKEVPAGERQLADRVRRAILGAIAEVLSEQKGGGQTSTTPYLVGIAVAIADLVEGMVRSRDKEKDPYSGALILAVAVTDAIQQALLLSLEKRQKDALSAGKAGAGSESPSITAPQTVPLEGKGEQA